MTAEVDGSAPHSDIFCTGFDGRTDGDNCRCTSGVEGSDGAFEWLAGSVFCTYDNVSCDLIRFALRQIHSLSLDPIRCCCRCQPMRSTMSVLEADFALQCFGDEPEEEEEASLDASPDPVDNILSTADDYRFVSRDFYDMDNAATSSSHN